MPSSAEVARSLYGAAQLARLDTSGMHAFDLSVDGFWRSFFAMVLVAPGYAILVAQKLAAWEEEVALMRALTIEGVGYVIGWAAFPIVAVFLTKMLGLARFYVPLIVATNWAAVLQMAAFLAVLALGAALGEPIRGLLMLVVTLAIIGYQWFVIRTALDTTGANAFGLLVVDLLLSAIVNIVIDGLLV